MEGRNRNRTSSDRHELFLKSLTYKFYVRHASEKDSHACRTKGGSYDTDLVHLVSPCNSSCKLTHFEGQGRQCSNHENRS